MQIEGPLRIGITEGPDGIGRELHFDFTPAFQARDLAARTDELRAYVARLRAQVAALGDDSRDRQGMMIILQVAETLLPHVAADEIPLGETIVVELAPDASIAAMLAASSH